MLFFIDKFFLVWYYIGVIKEEMIMKYKLTREDERKLFEAYDVLDRICNGYHIPLKYKDVLEIVEQQLAEKDKEIEELKYKIELLKQALEMAVRDKSNPLLPYRWYDLVKEVSNETNSETKE